MRLKEIPYLIWYSFVSLINDLAELLSSLKKAKTWSFILYATFFLAVYYKKYALMKIALPLILVLYIVRQHKEPRYNRIIRNKAFLKNDEKQIRHYYEKYLRQCYFSKKEPLNYEDYKKEEIKRVTSSHP